MGGRHSVNRVANAAGVKDVSLLTATKVRHRISTIYAATEVSEQERALFYKHMGHTENVNKSIYQGPLAELEIVKVGYHLEQIDKRLYYLV